MTNRPWPVPDRPWAMRMRWCDLLFAHWAVDATAVRTQVPAALELDLFDGRAYAGAVPFRMEGVTPRRVPALPGLEAFPELNLRTYVWIDLQNSPSSAPPRGAGGRYFRALTLPARFQDRTGSGINFATAALAPYADGKKRPSAPRPESERLILQAAHVNAGSKPGVWFFSLDAPPKLVVRLRGANLAGKDQVEKHFSAM